MQILFLNLQVWWNLTVFLDLKKKNKPDSVDCILHNPHF